MKGSHEMMKCRARATASKIKRTFVKGDFTQKMKSPLLSHLINKGNKIWQQAITECGN